MSEQQITVEQLMEKIFGCGFATSKEHYNTLLNGVRTMIEQFAAQQRADATRELQRDNLRIIRALVNCALAVGASASDHSTIEFLELIPEEVRLSFSAKYDAIEKLRAELAAAKSELESAKAQLAQTCSCRLVGNDFVQKCSFHAEREDVLHEWAERAKAAERQLVDAEKDAQRYRWLRDPESSVGSVMDKAVGYTPYDAGTQTGGYTDYEYRAGAELDAAIDAAIASDSVRDATGCPHLLRTTHKSVIDGSVERDRCDDCGEVLSIGVQAGEKQG